MWAFGVTYVKLVSDRSAPTLAAETAVCFLLTMHAWLSLYSMVNTSCKLKEAPSLSCLRVSFRDVGDILLIVWGRHEQLFLYSSTKMHLKILLLHFKLCGMALLPELSSTGCPVLLLPATMLSSSVKWPAQTLHQSLWEAGHNLWEAENSSGPIASDPTTASYRIQRSLKDIS